MKQGDFRSFAMVQHLRGRRRLGTVLGICAAFWGAVSPGTASEQQTTIQAPQTRTFRLSDLLARYGWTSKEQQAAFLRLCERAGVHLGAVESNWSPEEVVRAILTLVSETQVKFRNRQQGQERWETSPLAWMERETEATLKDLRVLGVQAEVLPPEGAQGMIGLLGATRGRMASRLAFAHQLVDKGFKVDHVALISGARPSASIDGLPDELTAVANRKGRAAWTELTEMDLLEDLYEQNPLPSRPPVVVINAPSTVQGDRVCRPTTQSTVALFVERLAEHPGVKDVFFVSNQPHVLYQKAVIESVFASLGKTDVTLHVVGEACSADVKAQCEALGAYLWGRALLIIRDLGVRIPCDLMGDFEKMFQDPTSSALLRSLSTVGRKGMSQRGH